VDNLSNIPKKIITFFTCTANKLAEEHQFKIRKSKLTPSAFIKALIQACLSETFECESIASALGKQKISITKQSIFDRFHERTTNFVKAMAEEALNKFKMERAPQNHLFEQFTAINIIDSTSVPLKKALNSYFKGCGGAASESALKIQTLFDPFNYNIKALELTPGCANDQGFDLFFDRIEKGALYLMDLGYFKLKTLKKIIDGNAFFITRLLTGTQVMTLEGLIINLAEALPKLPGQTVSLSVLIGARAKIPARLIAQCLPKAVVEQRKRTLRAAHKRRGTTPSKESLQLQNWSIYVTNTTDTQLSVEDIPKTYATRWQVELFFKLSKSLMNIDVVNTKKVHRVIIELYAKFLSIILLLTLASPVQCSNGKELSLYKACKSFMNNAIDFVRALQSTYRLNKFIVEFTKDLALHAFKDTKKKPPLFDLEIMDAIF
jgi:hypothetical protein